MAQRISTFKEGEFVPSSLPPLLDQLTDYDLVVSRDAIWAVAEGCEPRPSGKARFRLLAWAVSDACGVQDPLSHAIAEKVGKRLEAQASKVRGQWDAARVVARSMATPELAELAANRAERVAMAASQSEPYIGFHELEVPPPAPAVPSEPEPVLSRSQRAAAAALQARDERMQAYEREIMDSIPPIPSELAQALGSDGVQALWQFQERAVLPIVESSDWRDCSDEGVLPAFIVCLLHEVVSLGGTRASVLEECKETLENAEELLDRRQEELDEISEKDELIQYWKARAEREQQAAQKLSDELHEAKGQVTALKGVLAAHFSQLNIS